MLVIFYTSHIQHSRRHVKQANGSFNLGACRNFVRIADNQMNTADFLSEGRIFVPARLVGRDAIAIIRRHNKGCVIRKASIV